MKKSRLLLATLAAAALVPSFAFAQDHAYPGDDQRPGMEHRGDYRPDQRPDARFDHRPDQRPDQRPDARFDHRDDRRGDIRADVRDQHHWNHEWRRGDRLPPQFWDHRYVVQDWRAHRLSMPPRGYNWVQVNGDFVLAQIGTGVVLQMGF